MSIRDGCESNELIVVANRGPGRIERDAAGRQTMARASGGLAAALRPLVAQRAVTWIASAANDEERRVAELGPTLIELDGSSLRLWLIDHPREEYRQFYDVVANPALWFLQHGLWDELLDRDRDLLGAWNTGYRPVNRRFADAVVATLAEHPGASVLFQDYHLYVAPRLVRDACPTARLAHFVHIPWVSPPAWSVLPEQIVREIHDGLLAVDSIGFHDERWRQAFIASAAVVLGRGDDARSCSHANPIAVDSTGFVALAQSAEVRAAEVRLRSTGSLIVRVDRTDPSKNAVRGFRAFGVLLTRRPDLIGNVRMVALLDPSRQEIPEYRAYREAIEQAAADVNAAHGTATWMPLELRIRDDMAESIAAYSQYDVLLVNPVMDGLNLVAKEAPLVNERDGVVVLSRQAGAFSELGDWVVGVDPLDVDATATALETALELPAAQRSAWLRAIRAHLVEHDLTAWAEVELAELDAQYDAHVTLRESHEPAQLPIVRTNEG